MTSVYGEELEMFRDTVRAFLARNLEGREQQYEADGVDRAFWKEAGKAGLLGMGIPEEYGGPGADPLTLVVASEELGRSICGATAGGLLQLDICTHLLTDYGTEEQKRRYAPAILSGDALQCIAITEPDAGSDATAMRTTAVRDGDDYVINGSKCYISNGYKADILYLVAKTDPAERSKGMSMIIVPADTPGVTRRRMRTMGYTGGDVGEIFFSDVRVPVDNLVGREGGAMSILIGTFALDRLSVAARSLATAERGFEMTLDFVKTRKAFGQRIFDFQNTQFKLAEMKTELSLGRAFLNDMIAKFRADEFTLADSAMLKLWVCEMEGRVLDECVQLFGGAGFMDEVPISRMYTAARVARIYAGTSEMQKVAIARAL